MKKKKKKETGKVLLIKRTREKFSKEQIVQQTFPVHYTLSPKTVLTETLQELRKIIERSAGNCNKKQNRKDEPIKPGQFDC